MRTVRNDRRRPARQPLLPAEHEAHVARLAVRLDEVERDLAEAVEGTRHADQLTRKRLKLLGQIVAAEAEHEEASEPVAWRQAGNGRGIVIIVRGGWEVYCPDHDAVDAAVLGIDEIAF